MPTNAALLTAIVCAAACFHGAALADDVSAALKKQAADVLWTVIREGKCFEKAHAAEALLWSGCPKGVAEYFLDQEKIVGLEPHSRIAIWRVLYRARADDPAAQQKYFDKVLAVFSDVQAPDQATAAETLGKLDYADHTELVLDLAERGKDDLRVSARWILANSGTAEDEARLAELLRSEAPADRFYAAYAFRHFKTIRSTTLKALEDLAAREPADGSVRYFVLGTLYMHLPADRREAVKKELLEYAASGSTDHRYQSCMALANRPARDMIPVAEKLLANPPMDERVGGAYLLLRMGRPRESVDPH